VDWWSGHGGVGSASRDRELGIRERQAQRWLGGMGEGIGSLERMERIRVGLQIALYMYIGIGPSQMGLKHFGSPRGTGTGACIPSYPMEIIFFHLIHHGEKIYTIPVP